MKFKKIRNVALSYERQGQIFFTLANYENLPPGAKKGIDEKIARAAKGSVNYEKALRDWLIHGVPFEAVLQRHYVRDATLVRMRKEIYESW